MTRTGAASSVRNRDRHTTQPDKKAPAMTINLARMLNGYTECAEWADCGPDHETSGKDWSPELLAEMETDCARFVALCDETLPELLNDLAELAPDYSDERFGHDFWLTRNGHGAGFWDRKELEPVPDGSLYSLGDNLTEMAKRMGSCDLYVGDDNLVYAA